MNEEQQKLFDEVMIKIPVNILEFYVVALTNGSVTLEINNLTVDTYEFHWLFSRADTPVMVKVVGEISKKLLPATYKAES